MSFAGHVWDMIRRMEDNRKMLKQHRERQQMVREAHAGGGETASRAMSLEAWERMEAGVAEHAEGDRRYALRVVGWIAGGSAAVLLLLWLL